MGFREMQAAVNSAVVSTFKETAAATYTQGVLDPVELDVILSYPSVVQEQGGMAQVIAGKVPAVDVILADLDPIVPKKGDLLTLGAFNYKVTDAHPDGYGMSKINLQVLP